MGAVRSGDVGRQRTPGGNVDNRRKPNLSFINPYPWMSQVEAMVHIALEQHEIPFSWRYFDGVSPTFTQLMANNGYQPEFTLKEYKTVVLVLGGFFGTLPGVLENTSLATVTLQADGWRVITLIEYDIRAKGAWQLLSDQIPGLGSVTGPVRPNPYGAQDLMLSWGKRRTREKHPRLETADYTPRNVEELRVRRHIRHLGRRLGAIGRARSRRLSGVPRDSVGR